MQRVKEAEKRLKRQIDKSQRLKRQIDKSKKCKSQNVNVKIVTHQSDKKLNGRQVIM